MAVKYSEYGSHVEYVQAVRKQLAMLDADSPSEFGAKQRTRLTGDAYYSAKFEQCWLLAQVTFDDEPAKKFWFALLENEYSTYSPYNGLVSSMDETTQQIEEGWYAPQATGGQGN